MQYPLCTLLVFDSRKHALPVAWVITRTVVKSDVAKWMKALVDRVHTVDLGWKVNAFLVDDAAAEIDPIRQNSLLCLPFCFSVYIAGLNRVLMFIVGFQGDFFLPCPIFAVAYSQIMAAEYFEEMQ